MSEVINVAKAYDEGRTLFMGIELLVAPGALVLWPETELLCASAIDALRQLNVAEPRVIDMCCGAGNLACAIALKIPDASVWASDLTDGCVTVARRNVAYHGLTQRMSVLQGDLFDAFSGLSLDGTIDLIVCNPPYISETRLRGDRAPCSNSNHVRHSQPVLTDLASICGLRRTQSDICGRAASSCSRSAPVRSDR